MIAKHQNDRILIHLRKVIHQHLKCPVSLPHQSQIFFQFRSTQIRIVGFHSHIYRRLVRAVASVVLHRHIKNRKRLIGLPLFIHRNDIAKIRLIAEIPAQALLMGQFSIYIIEWRQPEQGVIGFPPVSIRVKRMIGRRRVSMPLKAPCERLLHRGDILHIGAAARRKHIETVAGQKFILGIGRSAARNRDQQTALDGIFLQTVDKGHTILFR